MGLTYCENGHPYDPEKYTSCPVCAAASNEAEIHGHDFLYEPGEIINGRYRIERTVGSGGMSVVYLVTDIRTNVRRALKKIKSIESNGRQQALFFDEEIKILEKLCSPYFPCISDKFRDSSGQIIVMDYIEGETLQQKINTGVACSPVQTVDIAKQLCEAIGYLHGMKPPVIFRDVKPGNIILQPNGKIRIIDFGAAKQIDDLTQTDSIVCGTAGFAAPEQYIGITDKRSDIYSIGVTIYSIATGTSVTSYTDELPALTQVNPNMTVKLQRIVEKCMEKDPAKRYQNCTQLSRALSAGNTVPKHGGNVVFQAQTYPGKKHARRPDPLIDTITLNISRQDMGFGADPGSYGQNPQTYQVYPPLEPRKPITTVPSEVDSGKYIFISYAHADKEKATGVISLMQKCGLRIWCDMYIKPGSPWKKIIVDHIKGCSYFISLVSDNYFRSESCTNELDYSVSRVDNRMMVYLEDISMPDEYELYHGKLQAIRRYRYSRDEDFIRDLCSAQGMDYALFTDINLKPETVGATGGELEVREKSTVFIAYSLNDYLRSAREFIRRLKEKKTELWHKLENCTDEERYADEARETFRDCRKYVFFLSDSLLGETVERELLDELIAGGANKEDLIGVVTDCDFGRLTSYFDKMTVINCGASKYMKLVADLLTGS